MTSSKNLEAGSTDLLYFASRRHNSVRLTTYAIVINQNQIIMHIFRSKQYKKAAKLLQACGFSSSDFQDYKIGNAANQIVSKGLLAQLKQVVKQQKMTHLKLLKTSLLVLHILQISEKVQQNSHIQEMIRELQARSRATLHYSRKALNKHLRARQYGEKGQAAKGVELDRTEKQICDYQAGFPQNVQQNSVSYLLGKLVQPLLHIQEKVLYCHELIYKPKAKMNVHICWATLNLLKKFAELGHVIVDIGRYYQQYVIAMVSTIRVLSFDIRMLYQRVADYLKAECGELQAAILNNSLSPFHGSSYSVRQVVMLLQEVERINENVLQIYCNKYFSELLVINHIYMPKIFSADQEHLQIIFSFLEFKGKPPRKHCKTVKSAIQNKPLKTDLTESLETA